MRAFLTSCTADHFQYFLPIWAWVVSRSYPGTHMLVVSTRDLDPDVLKASQRAAGDNLILQYKLPAYRKIVGEPGVANALRFLTQRPPGEYEHILITDVDLLPYKPEDYIDHWAYHTKGNPIYNGHRGPHKRPFRPEITGQQGWQGDWERISGGMFYVHAPRWYPKTERARRAVAGAVQKKQIPFFRELDEVCAGRIVKGSGLEMPTSKFFPPELRGFHMGDFKPSMNHRWQNPATMNQKLTDGNVIAWLKMCKEPAFLELRNWCCKQSKELRLIVGNMTEFCQDRLARIPYRVEGINA